MYLIAVCYALIYLYFQAQGIPAGDSGDLVTAAVTLGIAHPPGYPLYVMLGWVLNHLPVFTPAWRVGLLSSIPHIVTLIFVYSIVQKITKSKVSGLFASTVLFGNYIFFLYSITPEVFALLDMFIVMVVWLLLLYRTSHAPGILYSLSFLIGLSLTHHHLILFIVPAIIYYLFREGLPERLNWYYLLIAGIVGFIPYLYILYPPYGTSLIVWNPATNLENAIRLITRADYGTFQSALVYGQLPIQRFLNIQTYLQYIAMDFLWIGIVLSVIGVKALWKRNRSWALLVCLMVMFIGPAFYFYASFPLSYRFSLGTLERFLLPSYCLLTILIGIGYAQVIQTITKVTKKFRTGNLIVLGVGVLLFLYPAKLTFATLSKSIGYNTDKTAESVANDILVSLPKDSILLADRDTVLFTTEYVRYALNSRPDIILLQGFKLNFIEQHEIFRDRYPSLIMPDENSHEYVSDFIVKNIDTRHIFSYKKYPVPDTYVWEQHGLVYEVVTKEKALTIDLLQARQEKLWTQMQDPSVGILSRFNHLILSDVRDIYTTSRLEFGKTLLFANKYSDAIAEFQSALSFGGDATRAQTYMFKGIAHALQNQCETGIHDLLEAKKITFIKIPELDYYLGIAYRDCLKDQKKATHYLQLFESSKQTEEIPLQTLE